MQKLCEVRGKSCYDSDSESLVRTGVELSFELMKFSSAFDDS
jgi:hypothetical protein